jgi:hypothetical protein
MREAQARRPGAGSGAEEKQHPVRRPHLPGFGSWLLHAVDGAMRGAAVENSLAKLGADLPARRRCSPRSWGPRSANGCRCCGPPEWSGNGCASPMRKNRCGPAVTARPCNGRSTIRSILNLAARPSGRPRSYHHSRRAASKSRFLASPFNFWYVLQGPSVTRFACEQ